MTTTRATGLTLHHDRQAPVAPLHAERLRDLCGEATPQAMGTSFRIGAR